MRLQHGLGSLPLMLFSVRCDLFRSTYCEWVCPRVLVVGQKMPSAVDIVCFEVRCDTYVISCDKIIASVTTVSQCLEPWQFLTW